MTLVLKAVAIASVVIFIIFSVLAIFGPKNRLFDYIEKHEFLKGVLVAISVVGVMSILLWVNSLGG